MESSLELLERGFQGLMALKESMEKAMESDRLERMEERRQLNDLMQHVGISVESRRSRDSGTS